MPNMQGMVTDTLKDGTADVRNQNTTHVKIVQINIDAA